MNDAWFGLSPSILWTILVAGISNTSCALLGCYLVLRRLSLLGDAISHAVLPGIVLAYLLTGTLGAVPIMIGAALFGVLTTLLTATLRDQGSVPEDAGMGVVFTSLFALGVILLTTFAHDVHLDVDCVLYGLLEFIPLDTVSFAGWEVPRALGGMALTLLLVLIFVFALWKELKLVSFDDALATAMGFSATGLHYLLMSMVAIVTVTSFEAVGSILVIAMLIVPAATAQLLTDRLRSMLIAAVLVGWIAAIGGAWAATWLNTSVAGMMAVVAGLQFALAVFFAPRYGLVSRALHTLSLTLRIYGEDVLATLYRQEEERASDAEPVAVPVWEISAAGRGPGAWLVAPRLWWRGDVRPVPHGRLALTDRGRQKAQSLVRAHRLWEAYIGSHFELPLDHLHAPAERWEHYVGPALQAQMADELAQPGSDPHGRSIPE
jgi:ABC-type Mn2+/Zn2+ transport system permease subunit